MEGEELESLKTNIVEYLVKGTLLRDREKARKMRTQAAWQLVNYIDEVFPHPCLNASTKSRPTISLENFTNCYTSSLLHDLSPFGEWISQDLSLGPRDKESFFLVVVNYFMKQVELEPLTTITAQRMCINSFGRTSSLASRSYTLL